jgi:SAM-dependent methyltransferase
MRLPVGSAAGVDERARALHPFMRMNRYIGGTGNGAVFDRLQTLGDETRARLLLLLEDHEMTVSELCAVVQLPQSTVSRHLKVLLEDGWLRSRAAGTSRHYRVAELDGSAAELWRVVRQPASASAAAAADAERVRVVLAGRRETSRAFFSDVAGEWDAVRGELFGSTSGLLPFTALLDRGWVVADLGAGTGALTTHAAPFVERVIAVDGSPAMLEALAARASHLANVEVRGGELEALPIEDATVEVAFLVLALHYVVEPWAVLGEAQRVLRPGGRLIVVDMREHEREEYRAEMGHVWLGFAPSQLEGWARRAGFDGAAVVPLPPAADAKGPPLFAAVMLKAKDGSGS